MDVLELGGQIVGPQPFARLRQGRKLAVGRHMPAVPPEIGQGPGHIARQQHRRIVPGHIRLAAGQAAARLVIPVLRRVPAPGGNIDPAAHRELLVDHHDLLVMAASRRMGAVQPEIDRSGARPAQKEPDRSGMEELLQRAEIPFENVDFTRGIAFRQPEEEVSQRFGPFPVFLFETDPCVEIPAEYEDALARLVHRFMDQVVIIRRIHHHAGALGPFDPPAVPPFRDDRLHRTFGCFSYRPVCHGPDPRYTSASGLIEPRTVCVQRYPWAGGVDMLQPAKLSKTQAARTSPYSSLLHPSATGFFRIR